MAKRTNRVAWGLAAILAVGMLGGVGLLVHGARARGYVVTSATSPEWHFGAGPLVAEAWYPGGISRSWQTGWVIYLGPFSVSVLKI